MRKEYDSSKGKRGDVVPVPKGKTEMTIRIDDLQGPEVLALLREHLEFVQSLIPHAGDA